MIQVNLIPELKAEYLKAQRTKRFVMSLAFLIAAGFITLVVVLYSYVNFAQQRHTNNQNNRIQELITEFQKREDIDKVVTIQNQLEALSSEHEGKPYFSRLAEYLTIITPEDTRYRSISIDIDTGEISFTGTSGSVAETNRYVNTLKNARFTIGEDPEEGEEDEREEMIPFTEVRLSSLSANTESSSFSVRLEFNEEIFTSTDQVNLFVPEIDSTRSEIDKPRIDAQNADPFSEEGGN